MVERGEADDKILAVLLGDPTYGETVDAYRSCRAPIVDRLQHYFAYVKALPWRRARAPLRSTRCRTRWEPAASSRRRRPTTPTRFLADVLRRPRRAACPRPLPDQTSVCKTVEVIMRAPETH